MEPGVGSNSVTSTYNVTPAPTTCERHTTTTNYIIAIDSASCAVLKMVHSQKFNAGLAAKASSAFLKYLNIDVVSYRTKRKTASCAHAEGSYLEASDRLRRETLRINTPLAYQ